MKMKDRKKIAYVAVNGTLGVVSLVLIIVSMITGEMVPYMTISFPCIFLAAMINLAYQHSLTKDKKDKE